MCKSSPAISRVRPRTSKPRPPRASDSGPQRQQELRKRLVVGITILLSAKAMAFVGCQQIPDLAALRANRVHDGFCFAHGYAGVVLALNHEQRPGDALRIGERRDAP